MLYIIGILIALTSLVASVAHLGQAASAYFDFVGFVMVIGGTLATAAITLPWDMASEIFLRLRELFYRPMPDRRRLLMNCMSLNEKVSKGIYIYEPDNKTLAERLLKDGIELIQL